MKQNRIVVGLVGGSGSGKTYVGKIFEKRGCFVIDADQVARQVVQKGEKALLEIKDAFGDVIDADGNLNRKKLADIVFSDKEQLDILNRITHKYIKERILKMTEECSPKIVIWDAPTLFEANMSDDCDYIVCVVAPKSVRIKRIVERDGISADEAQKRMDSQKSDSFLINNSDFVILNDSTDVESEIENIIAQINTQE